MTMTPAFPQCNCDAFIGSLLSESALAPLLMAPDSIIGSIEQVRTGASCQELSNLDKGRLTPERNPW